MSNDQWTASLVEERLAEAAGVLKRLPEEKVQGYFSAWPDVVHNIHESFGWHDPVLRRPWPSPGSIDRLMAYSWHGNVRELGNVVERAMILNEEGPLRFEGLVLDRIREDEPIASYQAHGLSTLDDAVKAHIQRALNISGGKIHGKGGAADLLSVNPNTLRSKMKKLGLSFKRKHGI